jgi:molybdenum cofactor synthesis domain-containing protein
VKVRTDGRVVSVNVSEEKGVPKTPRERATFVAGHGIGDDAHAGPWHRQVSLLAAESMGVMRRLGADVGPGAFGENVTTEGIRVHSLPLGTRLRLGEALVEVTQIGKECHDRCAIFAAAGDCVMPREGVFARVLEGGEVQAGDAILIERASLIRAAVLTVSDKGARGERVDESGAALAQALRELGAAVAGPAIVADEQEQIAERLRSWADEGSVNLILTTGGTGMTSRDVTPEATLAVLDRLAPGFVEAMRAGSLATTPHAMLSRAVSGIRGATLIINMPGSPRACREQFGMIAPALPHAIEKLLDLGGDCAAPAAPVGTGAASSDSGIRRCGPVPARGQTGAGLCEEQTQTGGAAP